MTLYWLCITVFNTTHISWDTFFSEILFPLFYSVEYCPYFLHKILWHFVDVVYVVECCPYPYIMWQLFLEHFLSSSPFQKNTAHLLLDKICWDCSLVPPHSIKCKQLCLILFLCIIFTSLITYWLMTFHGLEMSVVKNYSSFILRKLLVIVHWFILLADKCLM